SQSTFIINNQRLNYLSFILNGSSFVRLFSYKPLIPCSFLLIYGGFPLYIFSSTIVKIVLRNDTIWKCLQREEHENDSNITFKNCGCWRGNRWPNCCSTTA